MHGTEEIESIVKEGIRLKQNLLADRETISRLYGLCAMMVRVLENGNRILFCGNGGSAADAQHISTELSGRFYLNRPPLDAEALHVNTSYLTAVANDFGYNEVFARALEAKGRRGDILIAISTSGNSENVVRAVEQAGKMGVHCVAWTGADGGKLAKIANECFMVPSQDTPRIQEMHILYGHIICQQVEEIMFGEWKSGK